MMANISQRVFAAIMIKKNSDDYNRSHSSDHDGTHYSDDFISDQESYNLDFIDDLFDDLF